MSTSVITGRVYSIEFSIEVDDISATVTISGSRLKVFG